MLHLCVFFSVLDLAKQWISCGVYQLFIFTTSFSVSPQAPSVGRHWRVSGEALESQAMVVGGVGSWACCNVTFSGGWKAGDLASALQGGTCPGGRNQTR